MRIAGAPRRDLALGIDHAMPRHVAARREIVQRVADLPGVSIESGQCRHLAVRGHAAARDAFHHGVDARADVGESHGKQSTTAGW